MTTLEGRNISWTATVLAQAYGVPEDAARAALDAAVVELVPEATSSEGWVAAATWDFTSVVTVTEAATMMVQERVDELTGLGIPRGDWQRVVTTASLVEAEATTETEMPLIASVIENRLSKGMRLELESTVRYVTGSQSLALSQDDLAVDSPYNTFTTVGLPPGAIATPSYAALAAAANPAATDYLYFVTVNLATGETAYATTIEEHAANVQRLQDRLDSDG